MNGKVKIGSLDRNNYAYIIKLLPIVITSLGDIASKCNAQLLNSYCQLLVTR